MKPTIAIDCDGVLLDWAQGFGKFVEEQTGIELMAADFEHDDCHNYPSFHAAGLDANAIDELLNGYLTSNISILQDDDIPVVLAWLKQWSKPMVVTNRPPQARVELLLQQHGIDLPVTYNEGDKTGWTLLVDDWSQHVLANQRAGGRSILFQQPWSRTDGPYSWRGPMANTWRDLAPLIESLLAPEQLAAMPRGPSDLRRSPPGTTDDYTAFMRKKFRGTAVSLSVVDE